MKHWRRRHQHTPMMLVAALLFVVLAAESVQAGGGVIEGQVVDQAGRPVGGYPVQVVNLDEPGPGSSALTNPDGKFWIYGLPPGRYKVSPLNQSEAWHQEITIKPEDEKTFVQLRVEIR